jgi:hypothetical protein
MNNRGWTHFKKLACLSFAFGKDGSEVVVASGAVSATAVYDPPSIASGASASTTVTVTGAAIGDMVLASFSLDLLGLSLSASVTAANTVTVVLSNGTVGAVDLASGTLKVIVLNA